MCIVPVDHDDSINARILEVSEDQISGFFREPFKEISLRSGVDLAIVLTRIQAMLRAGTIRRVRQTLLANRMAEGALVAWKVPGEKLDSAFDFMFQEDPFSGHVVIRSADAGTPGGTYRLWTTLKVPLGESLESHCNILLHRTGAEGFRLMRAKGIFTLGVGHVRRKSIQPGDKASRPAKMLAVSTSPVTPLEWKVLLTLKQEFSPEEICEPAWKRRILQLGLKSEDFFQIAESLESRRFIGRFSTFLEHVKPSLSGKRVTRFNALFHWAVPRGFEEMAGAEVGRHEILTHCYWREAGPEFNNVNIMAVAHGTHKGTLLAHKVSIDQHLRSMSIPVHYTNIFWGGRSEIKPSEISPFIHAKWVEKMQQP